MAVTNMNTLSCFKAYDIRGKLGSELNEHIAFCIGKAYASIVKPKAVAVGADVRLTSEPLKLALAMGLMSEGVDVLDIGLSGTEEIYFAAQHLAIQGAIEVTASHNPIDYNGMKLVREDAKPISGDSGLNDIKQLTSTLLSEPWPQQQLIDMQQQCRLLPETGQLRYGSGSYKKVSILAPYVEHLLSYIDISALQPLKLVVNSGNGAAGHVIDAIEAAFKAQQIPINFIKIHHQPDYTFPHGIPNPLLPENRAATSEAIIQHKADFGIAWDGDFDRCFLFDQQGNFIEGYYIVGLLAQAFLKKHPGQKIIHDPRLYWNTSAVVKQHNGLAILSKTGHAFIKERMRKEDAIYGGEMSAHHYFRDFGYCDSGMIPWLLVAELISVTRLSLAEQVQEMIAAYPSSGELNFHLKNPQKAINDIKQLYLPHAVITDYTDGLSMELSAWRFNIRCSNTENVLRLNVEAKNNIDLMMEKTAEITAILTEAE